MDSRATSAWLCAAFAASVFACSDDPSGNTTTTTGSGGQGGSSADGGGGAAAGAGGVGTGGTGAGGEGGGQGGSSNDSCAGYPPGAQPGDVGGETHCYWLEATLAPQIAANQSCGADGYLATIQSANENAQVQAVAGSTFPVWIGLRCDANPAVSCTGNKGNYAWMNGEPVSYDGWAAAEPATPRGAAMHDTGEWHGYDSLNNVYAFVCEAVP